MANPATTVQSAAPQIDRVRVRLPNFNSSDPELWFDMVDHAFDASGITTESTKFSYVLRVMDRVYATEMKDVIQNRTLTNPPAQSGWLSSFGRTAAHALEQPPASSPTAGNRDASRDTAGSDSSSSGHRTPGY